MLLIIRKYMVGSVLFLLAFTAQPVQANLATGLQNLNTEASALQSYMASVDLNTEAVCGSLLEANNMVRNVISSVALIDQSLAVPLTVDVDVYNALDQLFLTGSSIANEALRLSVDIQTLSPVAQALTVKDGITAMLQLSDDIGTMADRIGSMADNILVMSDNIGLMADRILQTQALQNVNIALTMDSILQTQTNMLTLVSIFETASYDATFDNLFAQGELLAARMMAVAFNPWIVDDQLRDVANDVNVFLQQVMAANDLLSTDSLVNTAYISDDTLIKLANLPLMMTSLATAIDGYIIALEGLQAFTSAPTLYGSMKSMLTLSADIGLMANRILEMADQILAMADNIGLQADQIVTTQVTMNVNIQTTQASILTAQEMAIGMIAFWNLD